MEATPPKKKKNAASHFRSRRKRIAHPLLGDGGATDRERDPAHHLNPPRAGEQTGEEDHAVAAASGGGGGAPVTSELRSALNMAARSPSRSSSESAPPPSTSSSSPAPSSYTSSVEAMAAHVQARATSSSSSRGGDPFLPALKNNRSPPRKTRSRGGSVDGGSVKSSYSARRNKSRKSSGSKSSAGGSSSFPSAGPRGTAWRIAVPIALLFLVCEFFLWLLVFRGAAPETVDLDPVPPVEETINLTHVDREETIGEDEGAHDEDPIVGDGSDASGANDAVSDISEQHGESGVEGSPPEEVGVDMDAEEPAEDLDMDVEEPTEGLDVNIEETTEGRDINIEETTKGPDINLKVSSEGTDLDVEEATESPDTNHKESRESSNTDHEGLTIEPGTDAEEQLDEHKLAAVESTEEAANDGDIASLQSMLEEGFARLRGSTDDESGRTAVESLCGNVWVIASEMLSSESENKGGVEPTAPDEIPEMTLEKMLLSSSNPWKSLALESQRCLGGAGPAFLAEEADAARLGVSTKIFDRLSYVDPYDPNVRAGLGTSLLLESIFRQDDNGDSNSRALDDARGALMRAKYHLEMASLLCTAASQETEEAAVVNDGADGIAISASLDESLRDVDENAVVHAAILHNLALAHIALGDGEGSVPILLRAAALRRELSSDANPYWNAPSAVLRAAEEKALLIGARTKRTRTEKRRRIPFLSTEFDVEEMAMI